MLHNASFSGVGRGVFIHTVDALVFMSGVLFFAAQGAPFDLLALVVRGTCIPGSHETVTVRKTVLHRLLHSGHCTDSNTNTHPGFLIKRPTWLFGSFGLKSRPLVDLSL